MAHRLDHRASVTSPDGTDIGSISDLIVDGDTGEMKAAIIGVGGFLGIGQKQIALPWADLTINSDAQEITSDLTREEAEAAPEYVFRDQEAPAGDMMSDPALIRQRPLPQTRWLPAPRPRLPTRWRRNLQVTWRPNPPMCNG